MNNINNKNQNTPWIMNFYDDLPEELSVDDGEEEFPAKSDTASPELRQAINELKNFKVIHNLDAPNYIEPKVLPPLPALKDTDPLSFSSMLKRAKSLEANGQQKFAAHYYLYCLDKFRQQGPVDKIAFCLNRLSKICYRNKKYQEAIRFQQVEKKVYESQLLAVERHSQKSVEGKESGFVKSVDKYAVGVDTCPRDIAMKEKQALEYERLGKVFFEAKNMEMAKSYIKKAIDLRNQIQKEWGGFGSSNEDRIVMNALMQSGKDTYAETLRLFKEEMGLPLDEDDKCHMDGKNQVEARGSELSQDQARAFVNQTLGGTSPQHILQALRKPGTLFPAAENRKADPQTSQPTPFSSSHPQLLETEEPMESTASQSYEVNDNEGPGSRSGLQRRRGKKTGEVTDKVDEGEDKNPKLRDEDYELEGEWGNDRASFQVSSSSKKNTSTVIIMVFFTVILVTVLALILQHQGYVSSQLAKLYRRITGSPWRG